MIRQLPHDVRSRIRSGVAITNVTQCVEELLLNAVDANSKCIAVRLDLSCFRIQVVDNGTGIAADQLDKIGQRYSTSKCHNVEDLESLSQFGYRGEALASIREVSYILEIISRARCSAQTYSKIFQQGRSLDPVEAKVHRPSPGTTITIHNLFYNLPVRQKSMSLTLEIENICHRVEALALIQPKISITLRNDTTGTILLQTRKTNSPSVTFSYLFKHSKTQNLVSVSNSVGHFCIKGYIGKESHYRKDLQFIYVNKRLVLKTQLHKLVNRILKKSLIVRQRQAPDTSEKLSPSKQADKYPVFVLNIECPLDAYDITFDPRKTMVEFVDWDTLSTGMEEMCKEFLRQENLLPIDCLFSEKRIENDNLNQEEDPNENVNTLLAGNPEQTTFDKIDDEMFNNIRTRGLKSCPIKRLYEENQFSKDLDSEQPTGSKQCKKEESPVMDSSDNINSQDCSNPSSVSTSNFSDSQTEEKLSVGLENSGINQFASELLPQQDSTLVQETILETEKMPFEELKTDISTQMTEAPCSDFEVSFSRDNKDSLGSHHKYSFPGENSRATSKSVSLPSKFRANGKLLTKHKICDKSKDSCFSLPSGINVPSMFRRHKRSLKELPPVRMSQSTKSILDQFRAPQQIKESTKSAVQRIKPNVKTLHCLQNKSCMNLKGPVKVTDSEEYAQSKEQQIVLKCHKQEYKVRPPHENLLVRDNEKLETLIAKKSSRNSIASKLSRLCKNSDKNSCSTFNNEMLLTTNSAGQNEKYKSDSENQKESNQNNLENQKMVQDISDLNLKAEMCYTKNSRKKEVEEEFTSLQEYRDSIVKSVPSFELVNPLQTFQSIVNKNNNPESFVCRQNLEKSRNLVGKKKQFFCSSAFLQTLDNVNPQSAKRETNHEKESCKESSKNFDSDFVQYFSGENHDNSNHFGSSRNCHRTIHYQLHENVCLPSHSKDDSDKDFSESLSESAPFSGNKTLSYQPCTDREKDIFSEEFSTESLQLAHPFSMNLSVEKPILSLDFRSGEDSISPSNMQDSTSNINFGEDILNSNFHEETQVCKFKQSNDTTSSAITPRDISLETTESCSFVETQGSIAELKGNILQKRDQVIPCPVSNLYFDKGGECVFGNQTVVHNVSAGKTDETTGKHNSVLHAYPASLIRPKPSFSYKGEKCTPDSSLGQNPDHKSNDTPEYLNEVPEIPRDASERLSNNPEIPNDASERLSNNPEIPNDASERLSNNPEIPSDASERLSNNPEIPSDASERLSNNPEIPSDASERLSNNPEISRKSIKMLPETSEVSTDCHQMSNKTYKLLSDASEKLEDICQISNETSRITNHTSETLNKISATSSDTDKIMSPTFEVSNTILDNLINTPVTSSGDHKIMHNTSEVKISTSKMPRNIQNSKFSNTQIDQCNNVSLETTTDQSEFLPVVSPLPVPRNCSPTSFTLLSTKLSSPLCLEGSTLKTNPAEDIPITAKEDFPLRKSDNVAPFLIKQSQEQCLLLHRSPSVSSVPESIVQDHNRASHCKDLDSDENLLQLEADCDFKTLSQQQVIKMQHSPSFSRDVDVSQDVEKSFKTSSPTLNISSDTEPLGTLILESSEIIKSEELSPDLAPRRVCIDSHNIQLMENGNHFENSKAILLQDQVPAKETLSQPSLVFDSYSNECQCHANMLESNLKTNENFEMECTQNPSGKTDESSLRELDVECDNDHEKESEQNITDENETDITQKLWGNWKNPIFQIGETDILDIWKGDSVQRKLHRVMHSCQFTKAMLSQMETIGQVDNKFIACIVKSQDGRSGIPDHLLIIDQHAAHERVRLEQLMADMYQSENDEESENLAVKSSQIFPPWTLNLSDKEMRIVTSFLEEFLKIGLQLKLQEGNIIEIHTAPSCIMTREASERRHNRNTVAIDLVQALIKEKIELLHDTRGATSTLPKTIHNLLCSQACHGAIKFNDPLTLVECQNLLKMLLKCKLPFQCAHGRPSVIPLVNLQHLKRILMKPERPKINLKKLQKQIGDQKKMNS